MTLFGAFSGLHREPQMRLEASAPLIVAIHGGTYTSAYFDVPGYSLLNRAAAIGLRIIAPDRNGYGNTPALPSSESTILGNARSLTRGLHDAWHSYGAGCTGMVLIGHSIGGAIAACIAGDPTGLPIVGLAISGIGLRMPDRHASMPPLMPDTLFVDMPAEAKEALMFGPTGSLDSDVMPAATRLANAPAPIAEVVDITRYWPANARSILATIAVPVHYRQGELDRLWIVDDTEVKGFTHALISAPRVDAALTLGTGHCIDFHRAGPAFQVQQLGFSLQCAVEAL